MNFRRLLIRELQWWWRSPALWWSVPTLIIFVSLMPQLYIYLFGLDFTALEGLWNMLSTLYQWQGKKQIKEYSFLLAQYQPMIDAYEALMLMPIKDLWAQYVVIPFQAWIFLPQTLVVAPLAVNIFKRDRDNGILMAHRANGNSVYAFLWAKLIANALPLLLMQIIAAFLYLWTLRLLTPHPEFFDFSDITWLIVFFGNGFALGLITILLCWWMCLISRNQSTEIYTALIAASALAAVALFILRYTGWNDTVLLCLSGGTYLSIPFLMVPILLRIKQESFILH
ncbi:MAG: hypothetical protein HQL32_08010 [Planctomycetes bacterium]|nr:hypothetical protein [Planctomycetota bacterium]